MQDNTFTDPFSSAERRASYEYRVALDCILPQLRRWDVNVQGARVLDLGCGTGGTAVAFAEKGAICLGIDREPSRIIQACQMAAGHGVRAEFVSADALNLEQLDQLFEDRLFDLVILSEVVEHLITHRNVHIVLSWLRNRLAPRGCIYISFPPWFNPFGGHQAGWPIIRCIPWFHLIPHSMKRILAPKHVQQYQIFFEELNHLTISSFENIIRETQLVVIHREMFYLRPEFVLRYGIPPVRSRILGKIPFLREFTTTGAFYLLAKPEPDVVRDAAGC